MEQRERITSSSSTSRLYARNHHSANSYQLEQELQDVNEMDFLPSVNASDGTTSHFNYHTATSQPTPSTSSTSSKIIEKMNSSTSPSSRAASKKNCCFLLFLAAAVFSIFFFIHELHLRFIHNWILPNLLHNSNLSSTSHYETIDGEQHDKLRKISDELLMQGAGQHFNFSTGIINEVFDEENAFSLLSTDTVMKTGFMQVNEVAEEKVHVRSDDDETDDADGGDEEHDGGEEGDEHEDADADVAPPAPANDTPGSKPAPSAAVKPADDAAPTAPPETGDVANPPEWEESEDAENHVDSNPQTTPTMTTTVKTNLRQVKSKLAATDCDTLSIEGCIIGSVIIGVIVCIALVVRKFLMNRKPAGPVRGVASAGAPPGDEYPVPENKRVTNVKTGKSSHQMGSSGRQSQSGAGGEEEWSEEEEYYEEEDYDQEEEGLVSSDYPRSGV